MHDAQRKATRVGEGGYPEGDRIREPTAAAGPAADRVRSKASCLQLRGTGAGSEEGSGARCLQLEGDSVGAEAAGCGGTNPHGAAKGAVTGEEVGRCSLRALPLETLEGSAQCFECSQCSSPLAVAVGGERRAGNEGCSSALAGAEPHDESGGCLGVGVRAAGGLGAGGSEEAGPRSPGEGEAPVGLPLTNAGYLDAAYWETRFSKVCPSVCVGLSLHDLPDAAATVLPGRRKAGAFLLLCVTVRRSMTGLSSKNTDAQQGRQDC